MTQRTKLLTLGIVVVLSGLLSILYAIRAARSPGDGESGVIADAAALQSLTAMSHVIFRSTRLGFGYGRVAVVAANGPSRSRVGTDLVCERLDMGGGMGVCLTADRGFQAIYRAVIFDREFRPLRTVPLTGIPSRVRVSPDGSLAAMTVFVSGHSYAQGDFSTATTLVDTRSGETLADLESFAVERDGKPFKAVDFNFWGVTFARDSNTFFATLQTAGVQYLIRGDVQARRALVLTQGIECPALSPDNTQLAFKKRVTRAGRLVWRLATLELNTLTERIIAGEDRSIDDQVQWLDDRRILYAVSDPEPGRGGTSIWVVNVDGGQASLWADGAYSPSTALGPQ
jgi:hypothetical protein